LESSKLYLLGLDVLSGREGLSEGVGTIGGVGRDCIWRNTPSGLISHTFFFRLRFFCDGKTFFFASGSL
jgi:hypothetical protein